MQSLLNLSEKSTPKSYRPFELYGQALKVYPVEKEPKPSQYAGDPEIVKLQVSHSVWSNPEWVGRTH